MSLKSKSVPFSDLSPGLREMLQWRQHAPDADPPDGLVTFRYPGPWAVVHHHEQDSWFLLTPPRHGIPTQAYTQTFIVQSMLAGDVKISYHLISSLIGHGVKNLNLKALKGTKYSMDNWS